MKAIMISIRPKHGCNILNLIKLWEIRKMFPKGYVGWVYIYCTKEKPYLYRVDDDNHFEITNKLKPHNEEYVKDYNALNGKVIARFWCDKVEEIKFINPNRTCGFSCEISDDDCYYNINEKECCLSQDDLYDYLQGKNGKAIHITNVQPFDKPKEIKEFYKTGLLEQCLCDQYGNHYAIEGTEKAYRLTCAPQNYCYIEV